MDLKKIVSKDMDDIAHLFNNESIRFKEEVTKEYDSILKFVRTLNYDRNNKFTDTIYETSLYLAIYNVFKSILPIYTIAEKIQFYYLNKIKANMTEELKHQGEKMFEEDYIKLIKKQAEKSLKKQFADDYLVEFIGGNEEFTYGNNTYKCPIQIIYTNNNGSKFLKYICAIDFIRSYYLKSGLERNKCLAYGDNYCSFRWTKNSDPKYSKNEVLININ